MKTSELLRAAADLLEHKALAKHHAAHRADGRNVDLLGCWASDDSIVSYCVLGTLYAVANEHYADDRAGRGQAVRRAWDELLFSISQHLDGQLSDWNDAPTRTKEDVLALLQRAARRAEERGQ